MNTKIFCLAILILTAACSPQTISSLSIKTSVEDEAQVSVGDLIELEVSAIDNDGIESVLIEILQLDINELHEDIAKKNWKKTQTIEVDSSAPSGTAEIRVVVTDEQGNTNAKLSSIEIQ